MVAQIRSSHGRPWAGLHEASPEGGQELMAARPYHQFVYQISKERERIQEESENGEGADAADINTMAYKNVKNTWNGRWGIWCAHIASTLSRLTHSRELLSRKWLHSGLS